MRFALMLMNKGQYGEARVLGVEQRRRDPNVVPRLLGKGGQRLHVFPLSGSEVGLPQQVGHPDDVHSPRAIQLRLGQGRKLRAFHVDVGAPAVDRRARRLGRIRGDFRELAAQRVGDIPTYITGTKEIVSGYGPALGGADPDTTGAVVDAVRVRVGLIPGRMASR